MNKVEEIIGLDITQDVLGQRDLSNLLEYIVTEYYPENVGDYLKKKKRLLEMAKKGKKKARK